MKVTQSSIMNGLNSDSHKILNAGVYSITTRTTMVQPSNLVVTIVQSGSTSKTITSLPTSQQSADIEVTGQFNCAVNDLITVSLTSSASADQPPSLIKTLINLRQGL